MRETNVCLHLMIAAAIMSLISTSALADTAACQGIRIGFHETIASQGFLGTLTPKPDASVVRRALVQSIEIGKTEPYAFNWDAVCRRAKAQNAMVLWVGCRANSHSGSFDYPRSYIPTHSTIGIVTAECVISTYNKPKNPSFSDLIETALVHSGGDQTTVWGDGKDRYDTINDKQDREHLYLGALKGAVYMVDADEKEEYRKTHPDQEYVYGVYDVPKNMPACDASAKPESLIPFEDKKQIGEQR